MGLLIGGRGGTIPTFFKIYGKSKIYMNHHYTLNFNYHILKLYQNSN